MQQRTCIETGCDKPVLCREVCTTHYRRHQRAGTLATLPNTPRILPTPDERFWPRVNKTDTCWIWTGRLDRDGYGRFTIAGGGKRATVGAHRQAYEWLVGPIPAGLTIDHLCRVRNCVNPAHLEPVTTQENTRRRETFSGGRRGTLKAHCVNGHQFTPDNTKIRRNGARKCRACDRDHAARAYMRRKMAA